MMKNIKSLFTLEFKKLLRTPVMILFGVAVPIFFLIIQGEMVSDSTDLYENGFSVLERAFPTYAFVSVLVLAFCNVGVGVAYTRSIGFLKRLKLASVSNLDFIVANFFVQLIVASLTITFLFVFSIIRYDLTLAGKNIFLFIGFLILIFIMCYFIGIFLANLTKDPRSSQSISLGVYFFFLFLGGVMFPLEFMPGFVQKIANLLPTTHGGQLLQLAWENQNIFASPHFIVVLISTLVFGALAVKFFKYE